MKNFVKIKKGSYRNAPIENAIFPVVKPLTFGKKGPFVTVDGSSLMGEDATKIRVLVKSPLDVIPSTDEEYKALMPVAKKEVKPETPEEASSPHSDHQFSSPDPGFQVGAKYPVASDQ